MRDERLPAKGVPQPIYRFLSGTWCLEGPEAGDPYRSCHALELALAQLLLDLRLDVLLRVEHAELIIRKGYHPNVDSYSAFIEADGKTMTIDGVWATIGSTNLDTRSFALNEELNAVLYDKDVASELEAKVVAGRDAVECRGCRGPAARGPAGP